MAALVKSFKKHEKQLHSAFFKLETNKEGRATSEERLGDDEDNSLEISYEECRENREDIVDKWRTESSLSKGSLNLISLS